MNFKMCMYSGTVNIIKIFKNRNTFFDSTVFFYFSDDS